MPPVSLEPSDRNAEAMYMALGQALDSVPSGQESLFLTKLAIMLALCIPDFDLVLRMIAIARSDISAPP
jgi:hypothetical protein